MRLTWSPQCLLLRESLEPPNGQVQNVPRCPLSGPWSLSHAIGSYVLLPCPHDRSSSLLICFLLLLAHILRDAQELCSLRDPQMNISLAYSSLRYSFPRFEFQKKVHSFLSSEFDLFILLLSLFPNIPGKQTVRLHSTNRTHLQMKPFHILQTPQAL